MKYNHYWGSPIPGCRHYIVEFQVVDSEGEIGKTSVMACSQKHAMCLVEKEFQDSNKKINSLRAWFYDDGFPTEKPDPVGKEKRHTPLGDRPF